MTGIPFIPSMRPEPARNERGMYLLPDPQSGATRAWTRATTIAHTLDDTFHLTQYQRRMVLQGAAARPDLLAAVPGLTEELAAAGDDWRTAKKIKEQLNQLCDQAAKAAGDGRAADLGTLLHTITEYDDAGRFDEIADMVPDMLLADLVEYRHVMDAAGLGRPAAYIERITVNSQVDGAGTFDRLLRLPDGRLVVGDLKTGASIELGALGFAIQFAEYAQADAMYDADTDSLVPLPAELDKTFGIVIHLPVGKATCTLYELDLVEGWEAALKAHWVRQRRRSAKSLLRPYTPSAPSEPTCPECTAPDDDPRSWCDCTGDDKPCLPPCRQRAHEPARCPYSGDRTLLLINSAGHPKALEGLWRELHPRGEWTDIYTAAARARKAQLVSTS